MEGYVFFGILVLVWILLGAFINRMTRPNVNTQVNNTDVDMEVPIRFLDCLKGYTLPQYMTKDSAAVDLVAQENITIQPGERTVIPTGLSGAIPKGHAGLVCSRSGIALKNGVVVANAPGVIDPDYRGEWKVILANLSDWPFKVKAGNRIAQLMIVPVRRCRFVEVKELDDTGRGQGGFGHTGD